MNAEAEGNSPQESSSSAAGGTGTNPFVPVQSPGPILRQLDAGLFSPLATILNTPPHSHTPGPEQGNPMSTGSTLAPPAEAPPGAEVEAPGVDKTDEKQPVLVSGISAPTTNTPPAATQAGPSETSGPQIISPSLPVVGSGVALNPPSQRQISEPQRSPPNAATQPTRPQSMPPVPQPNPPNATPPTASVVPGGVPSQGSVILPAPGKGPYTAENVIAGLGFPLLDDTSIPSQLLADQCNELYNVIIKVTPQALRRIVRDTWERSLAGQEAHLSFVMNAALDRATLSTVKTTAKLLGNKFMRMAGTELLSQATPELLGKMEDLIVSRAPDSLLDKAMRRRLDTIGARPLLNMLARAERLGYDANDIIEDGAQDAPAVAKAMKTAPAPLNGQAPLPSPNPPAPIASACAPLSCPLCHRQFAVVAVRDHHVRKKICTKPPTNYSCPQCGQCFSTRYGADYHIQNAVCGSEPGAQGRDEKDRSGSPIVISSGESSPVPRPATLVPPPVPAPPHAQPHSQSQPQPQPPSATPLVIKFQNGIGAARAPAPPRSAPIHHPPTSAIQHAAATSPAQGTTPKPATPGPATTQTGQYDPYAHLTPAKLSELNAELLEADQSYGEKMRQAQAEITDMGQLKVRLDNLKNSLATKQSMVRKKYGVRLRERRSKAEVAEWRARLLTSTPSRATTPSSSDWHHSKKARVSVGGDSHPTQLDGPPSGHYRVQQTPTRGAATADVAAPLSHSGLMGTPAVPERVDPTRGGTPSSLGRPPSHHRSARPSQLVIPPATPKRFRTEGPALATPSTLKWPVKLPRLSQSAAGGGSDSDSDSGSDVDMIPAKLPPPPDRANRH